MRKCRTAVQLQLHNYSYGNSSSVLLCQAYLIYNQTCDISRNNGSLGDYKKINPSIGLDQTLRLILKCVNFSSDKGVVFFVDYPKLQDIIIIITELV